MCVKVFKWYNKSLKKDIISSRDISENLLYHYPSKYNDEDYVYDNPYNRYSLKHINNKK
jgi:hypothetical protein